MSKLKFQSFLLTKDHVDGMVKALKQAGIRVEQDKKAGTISGFFKNEEIFSAIEKGSGQPWIVRHVVGLFS